MHDELNWDYIDDIVDVYANAYVYGGRQRELEACISAACDSLSTTKPTMYDFTYFLDTGLVGRTAVQRKIAWAAQHIYNMRAWAVGPHLFEKRDRQYFSPLLEQLRVLGIDVCDPAVHRFRRQSLDRAKKWSQVALDAFLFDQVTQEVVLVKGCSWSQAKSLDASIKSELPGDGLFSPTDRVFTDFYAKAEAIRPLLHAKKLIELACPSITVKCEFMLVDDPGCSWRFQSHDMSSVDLRRLARSKTLCLDDLPCTKTFLDFEALLYRDSDAFAQLPKWSGGDFLNLVPIDRPTRSLMQLQEIFTLQELTPNALSVVPASAITKSVSSRYHLFYPANRQRHDLEGVLRSGGFVRRPRTGTNSYGITAKGIARSLIMKQKFQPSSDFSSSRLIIEIQRQAELWHEARGHQSR